MPIAYVGNKVNIPWKAGGFGSSGTGAMTVPTEFFFPTTTARDTYFTANPTKLKDQVLCAVGTSPSYAIYQYDGVGSVWNAITPVFVGPAGANGTNGKNPEFRFDEDSISGKIYLQYRLEGSTTWINLLEQDELILKGEPGDSVGLRVGISDIDSGVQYLQWKYASEQGDWKDIIKVSELKGPKGDDGDEGVSGKNIELQKTSTHIQWRVEGGTWANLVALADLGVGITGDQGYPGESPELRVGVDSTGNSNELYIQWQFPSELLNNADWINLVKLADLKGANGTNGVDGDSPMIQVTSGASPKIQWKLSKSSTWTDLIAISELKGDSGDDGDPGSDGKTPEIRAANGKIQWKYTDESSWTDIVNLADLKGSDGTNGNDGDPGVDGDDGQTPEFKVDSGYVKWKYEDEAETEWRNLVSLASLTGAAGTDGDSPELKVDTDATGSSNDLYIQWKLTSESTWKNLIKFDDLKGEKGDAGDGAGTTIVSASDGYIDVLGLGENPTREILINLCSLNKNLAAFRKIEVLTPDYQYVVSGKLVNGGQTNKFIVDGMMYDPLTSPTEPDPLDYGDVSVRDKLYFICPSSASDEMMIILKTSKQYTGRLKYKVYISPDEDLGLDSNDPIIYEGADRTAFDSLFTNIKQNVWDVGYTLHRNYFRNQNALTIPDNDIPLDICYQEVNFGLYKKPISIIGLTKDTHYITNDLYLIKLRNMVQVKLDVVFSTGTTIPNTFSIYNDDPSDITGVQYLPLFRPVFQNIVLLSNDDEIISYGTLEINKLSSGYGLIMGVNFFRNSGNEFVVPYGKTANLKVDFTYITN